MRGPGSWGETLELGRGVSAFRASCPGECLVPCHFSRLWGEAGIFPLSGGKPVPGTHVHLSWAGSGAAALAEAAGSGARRPGGCTGAAVRGAGSTCREAGCPLPGFCGEGEPGICLSAMVPPGLGCAQDPWGRVVASAQALHSPQPRSGQPARPLPK